MTNDAKKVSLEQDFPTIENICVMANALDLIGGTVLDPTQVVHIDITMAKLMSLARSTESHPVRDRLLNSLDRILDVAKQHGYYYGASAPKELLITIYETAREEAEKFNEDGDYLFTIGKLHEQMLRAASAIDGAHDAYFHMHAHLHEHD